MGAVQYVVRDNVTFDYDLLYVILYIQIQKHNFLYTDIHLSNRCLLRGVHI